MARPVAVDIPALLARIGSEGPDALLSLGEAAALVASRTMQPLDYPRGATSRVRMQLVRAICTGLDVSDGGLAVKPEGRVTADELSHWTRRKHPGKFADLPFRPRVHTMSGYAKLTLKTEMTGFALPASLSECHALIRSLHERARELEQLRPDAEAFRQLMVKKAVLAKKLSKAGAKGGRPPKSVNKPRKA